MMGLDNKKLSYLIDYLHNNITEPQKCENLADSYPNKELADKYNCHRDTISRLLNKHDIVITKAATTRGKETEIVNLYESGLTSRQIAKRFRSSKRNMLRCLHEQNVKLRLSANGR